MQKSGLYIGEVFHKRFTPKTHSLAYKVFNLFIDLDDLSTLSTRLRFFSVNSFNLISFYEKDYGDPKANFQQNLKSRIIDLVASNCRGIGTVHTIKLLTYPCILGFTFNPVSVFYCYDENNKPVAVVYEVRNTFGERHNYIFTIEKDSTIGQKHRADKHLHVSPFFDKKGQYTFKLTEPSDRISVSINYSLLEEKRLLAIFRGKFKPLTDAMLLKLCIKIPFLTFKVVAAILFEAFLLWLKGIHVFSHTEDHTYATTLAIPEEEIKPAQNNASPEQRI